MDVALNEVGQAGADAAKDAKGDRGVRVECSILKVWARR